MFASNEGPWLMQNEESYIRVDAEVHTYCPTLGDGPSIGFAIYAAEDDHHQVCLVRITFFQCRHSSFSALSTQMLSDRFAIIKHSLRNCFPTVSVKLLRNR
jgi:deoxyhypusine synthase